jgi:GT2 family glycosyltransferase
MSNSLVTIIILNWNGRELLQECLNSVIKTEYKPIEIVVVDNGSTDDSVEFVRKDYKTVTILENGENLGYSEGNNRGIAIANGKYVVTLNNDIIVEKDWLNKPIIYLDNDMKIGAIGCRQMNYYNRSVVDSYFHYPVQELTLARLGYGELYKEDSPFSVPGYVISPNGGSAIYRKDIFIKIIGFDSNFFAYNDETDLCMRIFLNGWKCVYAPQAVVYHKDSASFKKTGGKRHYFHERNRIWFIYKYFPLSFIAKHIIAIIIEEMRVIKRFFFVYRIPLMYFKARMDGIAGIFKYSKERKYYIKVFYSYREEYELFQNQKIIRFK